MGNDLFLERHIGVHSNNLKSMLKEMNYKDIDDLINKVVPSSLQLKESISLPDPMTEATYLKHIYELAKKNMFYKSYIGQGYYGTYTPSVIMRNIFENPGWYTPYTPYQAEIAQGRLESLLNYQTVITELTGLPIANASLLDEATAAAEAMTMLFYYTQKEISSSKNKFLVDSYIFAQTKSILYTRAIPLGIEIVEQSYQTITLDDTYFGAILQYPNSHGAIEDYKPFITNAHTKNIFVVMATDLLALCVLTPPKELDADIAIGSSQRFGVPIGYGGPHAAFFACKEEFTRYIPGRIIGVSVDAQGQPAYRMSLQTREQHIRREKATSNICTAQSLLANIAAFYVIYHGQQGLKKIALTIVMHTKEVYDALCLLYIQPTYSYFFDTLHIKDISVIKLKTIAESFQVNLFYLNHNEVTISLDETTTKEDVEKLIQIFSIYKDQFNEETKPIHVSKNIQTTNIPSFATRRNTFLTQPIFSAYRSETQLMRYIKKLENKDLALNRTMIPLGSCTMKLNAACEMMPISWKHWNAIHPFAPVYQTQGYQILLQRLKIYLCNITGFDDCSLQPNSGAQGEYAGLLTIRSYHLHHKSKKDIVLIPISAHGTNPASAIMAGFKVVVIKSTEQGYIDIKDIQDKIKIYSNQIAALMITYPSTFGMYEDNIQEITKLIHEVGGLIYMDGANMNAQIGLTQPKIIGADICHLNLHKTFAIPHGGGGPGMGPICCTKELAPFLPSSQKQSHTEYTISAAPFGSALILVISYGYIRLLGEFGLKKSSINAILNANYMRAKLQSHYSILFATHQKPSAHEFIIDLRPFKLVGIEADDIAKRLIDFGFHAPTMSFPIAGTLMVEPTESEDKEEMDRFCNAMIAIRTEIQAIQDKKMDSQDNVLKNSPHTELSLLNDNWKHPYSRYQAAYPLPYLKNNKYWSPVARINNAYGDRNLICTCSPTDSY